MKVNQTTLKASVNCFLPTASTSKELATSFPIAAYTTTSTSITTSTAISREESTTKSIKTTFESTINPANHPLSIIVQLLTGDITTPQLIPVVTTITSKLTTADSKPLPAAATIVKTQTLTNEATEIAITKPASSKTIETQMTRSRTTVALPSTVTLPIATSNPSHTSNHEATAFDWHSVITTGYLEATTEEPAIKYIATSTSSEKLLLVAVILYYYCYLS